MSFIFIGFTGNRGGVCLPLVAILNACIQIYNQYNLLVLSGEDSALSPR